MSDSSPITTPVHSEAEYSDSDHESRRGPRPEAGQDEPSGEDLDTTANRDYRAIPALDTYEGEGLDAKEYPEISLAARLDAENEIRCRRNAARGPGGLDWDSDEEATFLRRQREQLRRQRRGQDLLDLDELLKPDTDNPVELQEQPGVLSQYLERPEIRREIIRRFQDFLVRFQLETEEKTSVTSIRTMGSRNLSSFDVDYRHLAEGCQLIAVWLGDTPTQVLPLLDEAAFQLVITGFFPEYARIAPEVHVRIAGLPICDNIRDLRQTHLNVLIRTVGVVMKATTVLPQLRIVKWRCGRCNYSIGPFPVTDDKPVPPSFCPVCNARTEFRINSAKTVYQNYQGITIQEPPGSVPAARLPRTKDVIMQGDLTDCCRPGEQIDVTGIYKHVMEVRRQGFPVFATMIEANHISRSSDQFSIGTPTEEEKRTITELSQRPDIAKLIFDSIAPSIFGHDDIKAAIALALFGSRRKDLAGRHCVRGDINVLLRTQRRAF
jgi:DNA replication licensing factor MCM2